MYIQMHVFNSLVIYIKKWSCLRSNQLRVSSGGEPRACVPQQAICIIENSKRFTLPGWDKPFQSFVFHLYQLMPWYRWKFSFAICILHQCGGSVSFCSEKEVLHLRDRTVAMNICAHLFFLGTLYKFLLGSGGLMTTFSSECRWKWRMLVQ